MRPKQVPTFQPQDAQVGPRFLANIGDRPVNSYFSWLLVILVCSSTRYVALRLMLLPFLADGALAGLSSWGRQTAHSCKERQMSAPPNCASCLGFGCKS